MARITDVDRILWVDALAKFFANQPALFDISFEVSAGDLSVIVGPNGSGKTTLLRLLAGLASPSEGRIEYFGRPGQATNWRRRAEMAFLPDHSLLYQQLTLEENFELLRHIYSVDRARLGDAVTRFQLEAYLNLKAVELSKGLNQRAMIAFVSARAPRLLLLDEPFTALDLSGQDGVVRWLTERHESKLTTVVVTHTVTPLDRTWTQLIALRRGMLVTERRRGYAEETLSALCGTLQL